MSDTSHAAVEAAGTTIAELKKAVSGRLLGLGQVIDDMLIALMAGGHILLEDVPGVGKTALAKAFADALGFSFHRIQCTPDLLPADITGGLVFHPGQAEFVLRKGPIFANLLLVDEINRALPRTQSALLEAMGERQVTIDGEPHGLPRPFMVIATQNPIESQGVFPLPEAQLDRFLLKTRLGYPGVEDDIAILSLHLDSGAPSVEPAAPPAAADPERAFMTLERAMAAVAMSRPVKEYASAVVRATREHAEVAVGASPRAMIMLAQAAKAAAVLEGRGFVLPDDVQRVATGVLFHRLVRLGVDDTEVDGSAFVQDLLSQVEVPHERGLA